MNALSHKYIAIQVFQNEFVMPWKTYQESGAVFPLAAP